MNNRFFVAALSPVLAALGCLDPTPPLVAPAPLSPPAVALAPSASATPAPPPPATPAPPPKPTWPPAFDQALAVGCLAWSEAEATAACVTGGGSIANGHAYALVFVGGAPARVPIVSWPAQDFDDHPLVLDAREREKVRARFVAGGYALLPPPAFELTPAEPVTADRFLLRVVRKKLRHVDIPLAGSWDVFRESVEVACRAPKPSYREISTVTIENPTDVPSSVHLVGGRWLLVGHRTSYGIEGDIGGHLDVKLFDLDKAGCAKAR